MWGFAVLVWGRTLPDNDMCTLEDLRRFVRPIARGRIVTRRSTVRGMNAISQVFPLNSVRPSNTPNNNLLYQKKN
ncbi:hypothetical protein K443DRAFT_680279 [Laccaria amethystina LaAM-08-1]|uniref:Uncharacterized protein n=1 Tax=Laccaria amethystina LaAM-08-1 TaxID=1095629 RepID=A0A0C9XND8_9AGAR|nr:hypothetical protein K443DRAFT_680279 [Laccaria amethystina LaAM-08-1]